LVDEQAQQSVKPLRHGGNAGAGQAIDFIWTDRRNINLMNAVVGDKVRSPSLGSFGAHEDLFDRFAIPITTRPSIGSDEQELAMRLLRSFLADENGATAIEYGLIAAGIALAIVTIVNSTGAALLNNKFNSVSTAMK
jgi:pilus assembly protein Flp/PilA